MKKKCIVVREKLEGLNYVNYLISDMEKALERDRETYKNFPHFIELVEMDTKKSIEELEEQKQAALAIIDKLDNPLKKRILMERYINGKTWEEVSELVSYAKTSTFRLHGEALEELEEIIQKA